jgi:hypothetical protein
MPPEIPLVAAASVASESLGKKFNSNIAGKSLQVVSALVQNAIAGVFALIALSCFFNPPLHPVVLGLLGAAILTPLIAAGVKYVAAKQGNILLQQRAEQVDNIVNTGAKITILLPILGHFALML